MKIDSYIEIVASSNPRLNAMSRESRLTILGVLQKRYTRVAITIVNNIEDLERLVAKKPDLVVLGMKLVLLDASKGYDDSPKVWLSDYLSANGISYTGSNTQALRVEFDKPLAKQQVIDAGLQSSKYFISSIKHPRFNHSLSFPLFVKPTNRGDSKGIDEQSVVHSQADLRAKILSIHADCQSDVLVEEYLSGREFSVAVIKQPRSHKLLAMPIEIIAPKDSNGNSFLSEFVKEADSETVSAVTDPGLITGLNALAIGVFKALGSRDYGRIDIRLDANGTPNFIEANLMPGLSDHGYLSRCFFLNNATSYEDMILSIVNLGINRISRKQMSSGQFPPVPRPDNTVVETLVA